MVVKFMYVWIFLKADAKLAGAAMIAKAARTPYLKM